jgi:hypothetical protein
LRIKESEIWLRINQIIGCLRWKQPGRKETAEARFIPRTSLPAKKGIQTQPPKGFAPGGVEEEHMLRRIPP